MCLVMLSTNHLHLIFFFFFTSSNFPSSLPFLSLHNLLSKHIPIIHI